MATQEEKRRFQTKQRLRERLRDRKSSSIESISLKELEALCDENTGRLVGQINAVSNIGIPDMAQPKWSDVLALLSSVVRRIDIEGEAARRGKSNLHSLKTGPRNSVQYQHIEEAKLLLADLRNLVARLPRDHCLVDPARLGFRSTSEVAKIATAHVGNQGDSDGARGFITAKRELEELGIPKDRIGIHVTPRTKEEWQQALGIIEEALLEFTDVEAKGLWRPAGNAAEKRSKLGSVNHLQEWISHARTRFT